MIEVVYMVWYQGFRKIVPERWEFANEEFVRGQRHLLKNIHRRKAVHSLSLHHNASVPLSEDEKHELEEEIDRLKHDKQIIVFELQKHTVQQHGMESLMQVLEERLHIMEQRQKDIVAFLAKVVETPGCVPDLFNQSSLHHKKRRLPKIDYFFEEANNEEKQILSFPAVKMEQEDIGSMQKFDTELFDNMEASISSLEAFFCNVSEASGEDLWNDDRMLCQPSFIVPTKTNALLEEEANVNRVENMVGEADLSANQSTRTEISTLPTSGNDAFWEQFLSETPGSSESKMRNKRRVLKT
ncbi:hypothetical protein J5N97_004721 [Dioscorea zingiberensis]|uniref:Uncharacterized protein n=1 Tax=Dioscorea zingiberensis TaxID=325984 RepID=A0A9D5D968_9LILI|nr:hypothetical protein J5N97_004721 [Dioscorea zingiberensis]